MRRSRFRERNRRQVEVVGPMQAAVSKYVSSNQLILPSLVRIVAEKLEAQGATLTDDLLVWLKGELHKRIINHDGLSLDDPIHSDVHLVDFDYSINLEQSEIDELSEDFLEKVASFTEEAIESCFEVALADVREQTTAAVSHRQVELDGFHHRLQQGWAKPLQLFALQLGLSIQFGADLNQWTQSQRSKGGCSLIECMLRLHARACQIAGEVEALLRAGFADGALSRWRTLHEVTVIAMFLNDHGEDVSQRYLDHLVVDSLKLARRLEAAHNVLGHRPGDPREMQALKDRVASMKLKYGDDFGEEYGWAASALNKKKPNFADIEDAVSLKKYRPYYKLASDTIHAGPTGAFRKLGLTAETQHGLLAGPSHYGLEEAGRLTTHTLSLINVAACMVAASVDAVVWARVITKISSDVDAAFTSVSNRLLSVERRFKRGAPSPRSEQEVEKLSTRLRRRQGKI